jgi:thioredoxin-like negative regulator of GroEL
VAVEDEVARVRARLDLVRSSREAAAAGSGSDPVAATYGQALERAGTGDYDAAVDALLGLLPAHRDWQDGAVRRALLEIFQVLEGDSRLKDWRARMARSLH